MKSVRYRRIGVRGVYDRVRAPKSGRESKFELVSPSLRIDVFGVVVGGGLRTCVWCHVYMRIVAGVPRECGHVI